MGATKKMCEDLYGKDSDWDYQCDLYAQEQQAKIREINAFEIAFGNIRQDEEVEVGSN
jgi:hypothetical protein